ncbi:MAG: 4'-phosphopantetheinyl transferase superfamily protein [Anaerolineae bacterium]|nr:4'-phosphopantetheinyl transferase superfamily protein [Caldilineales bacterium]MDW8270602.1 4'-phosphopantetheinyl transferase superfamily protein [Anaerolineae bacterium]
MLLHLLQTFAAHPDLATGQAPAGLLHPFEEAQLAGLRVVKRRREWLLGRWTAKHLVRLYLAQREGQPPPALAAIVIAPDPDGAPYAARALADELARLPLSLSISHSGDRAFCALDDRPGVTIGADIERIEPREPGLVAQFFAPAEQAVVAGAPAGKRDGLITAIWSAKEAVLKALRLGLRVDTRQLSCLPMREAAAEGWLWLAIAAEGLPLSTPVRLRGRWRMEDGFVQTLAWAEARDVVAPDG